MKLIKQNLLVMLVFLSTIAFAQDHNKFSKIEEFHERKWQALITQAQLSPKEAEDVKPVFIEHENLTWKLHQENREFKMIDFRQLSFFILIVYISVVEGCIIWLHSFRIL